MKLLTCAVFLCFIAMPALAQTEDQLEAIRKKGDADLKAAHEQHDWWLVSTSGYGATQNRFYVDRNKMVSMEPMSRAWVDYFVLTDAGQLSHSKVLLLADCNERQPQTQFRTYIDYGDGSGPPSTSSGGAWEDVVPDTSQETLWRFTCHSQPANAIVYVPDEPEQDAARYFSRVSSGEK